MYKINFFWKKWGPNSSFVVAKKAPSPWNNCFFEKKVPLAYLYRYDLQNSLRKFFLKKMVSRYLSVGDFKVPKICSSQ